MSVGNVMRVADMYRHGFGCWRQAFEDWVSGDTLPLLDVIAGDRKQATAVLAKFRQLSGERPVKVHPIVARSVDPAVLEKMRCGVPKASRTSRGVRGMRKGTLAVATPFDSRCT